MSRQAVFPRSSYARIWALAASLACAACPEPSARKPEKVCEKAYEKCVLPSGVLGLCDPVACPEGQPGPCMVCRSQH